MLLFVFAHTRTHTHTHAHTTFPMVHGKVKSRKSPGSVMETASQQGCWKHDCWRVVHTVITTHVMTLGENYSMTTLKKNTRLVPLGSGTPDPVCFIILSNTKSNPRKQNLRKKFVGNSNISLKKTLHPRRQKFSHAQESNMTSDFTLLSFNYLAKVQSLTGCMIRSSVFFTRRLFLFQSHSLYLQA